MAKRALLNIKAGDRRRIAVAADCDPRTVMQVARGAEISSSARRRADEALKAAGYLVGLAHAEADDDV